MAHTLDAAALEDDLAEGLHPERLHPDLLAEMPDRLAGNPHKLVFSTKVRRADGLEMDLADPRITRLTLALMDMNAVMGGAACHWGGPSAFSEIMSAIHGLMFAAEDWREAYNFVNDAGHGENGIYALRANYGFAGLSFDELKTFRSAHSRLTGHGETQCFPQGVMVSNGPLGSALPVAEGLAMADRMAGRDRVTLCTVSDGASMEGEAREAMASIAGLAGKGQLAPFVMVLSDNDTAMSGRISKDIFSMQPTFKTLDDLGWKVILVGEGHNLQIVFSSIEKAVAEAKACPQQAVAVWCKTVKGKGVEKTEQNSTGGHAFPLKSAQELRPFVEEINGGPIPQPFSNWLEELEEAWGKKKESKNSGVGKGNTSKVQAGLSKAAIAKVAQGFPLVSVSADVQTSTTMDTFHAEHPHFSRRIGVAEANMISVGAGFSKMGFIPIVDTFAQFGTTKGALPMIMANISRAPVIAIFTHAGFQDAADGASHQSLQYLAMTAAIPHLEQYCPATAEEAEWAMHTAVERFVKDRKAGRIPRTIVFFCGRENFPVTFKPEGAEYAWGRAMVLADTVDGKDRAVAISATGSMVQYALQAAERLEGSGVGTLIINNSSPNHPDIESHSQALSRCGGRLVTVEDHQVTGGAGSMLISALARAGIGCRVKSLGVEGEFGRSAYVASELYDLHGMGTDGIVRAAESLV